MDISFIIPAYNEEDHLPRSLSALKEALRGRDISFEIIVVDNNSSDRSAQVALEHGACKTVFEPVNNIARSRNAGAKAAAGRLLVFIDADTCVGSALIEELLRETASEDVCGGGSRISFDVKTHPLVALSMWLFNLLAPALRYAAGAFSFCTKEAFEGVGGFDEGLYAAEDIDFSIGLKRWARKHGKRLVTLRGSVVSSARRVEGKSVWPLILKMLSLVLMPWRLRSKTACSLWYDHTTRN